MLKLTKVSDTLTANRLIKLWAARYVPMLSTLRERSETFRPEQVVDQASPEGRLETAAKVRRLLKINCEMAGLETSSLFSYIPNIVNLAETRELSNFTRKVYEQTLNTYEIQQPPSRFLKFIDVSFDVFTKLTLPSLMLPLITQLADQLADVLLQLQHQYHTATDRRTIGFLTTQFHFTTRELSKNLTVLEQVLLLPYFKFVEEQVCIPWQRICAATAGYLPYSSTFQTVERLVELANPISIAVYQKGLEQCSHFRSRRGTLANRGVAISTMRDLTMVQAYLTLSMLEGNMRSIEDELLPLCVMVFPSVNVQWEMVQHMLKLLVDEMNQRLTVEQQAIFQPYGEAIQHIFAIPDQAVRIYQN